MKLYWCRAVCRLEEESSRCRWCINSLSSLVTHPALAAAAEFQLHLVQFLFINSFFIIKHKTSDIPCVSDRTRWAKTGPLFESLCSEASFLVHKLQNTLAEVSSRVT